MSLFFLSSSRRDILTAVSDSEGAGELFQALHQLLKRYWLSTESYAVQGVLSFPPSEEDQLARVLFSKLDVGGFATLVVSGRRRWNPQSNYFESARAAARRGCKITRAFLLPHRQYLNDEVLQQHWLEDERAGIEVLALYISDLLAMSTVPAPSTLDIGIWDGSLTCSSFSQPAGSERGVVEWRVSARPEDLQLAESLREELLTKAERLPAPGKAPTALTLEEPMVRTAPLAELLAQTLCRGAYVSPEDCSWYHGFWQYLRIFDLVSTPTWHSTFYLSELDRVHSDTRSA